MGKLYKNYVVQIFCCLDCDSCHERVTGNILEYWCEHSAFGEELVKKIDERIVRMYGFPDWCPLEDCDQYGNEIKAKEKSSKNININNQSIRRIKH